MADQDSGYIGLNGEEVKHVVKVKNAQEICRRESLLDGKCSFLRRFGSFPRHLMERFELMAFAGKTGKTRIVIEYDNDTGEGWMRCVRECEEGIPMRRDQEGHLIFSR